MFFVGTATVLLRSRRQRLTGPALEIDQLPPLDLVVLSDYHGDHFDRIAEQRLDRTVPIVTTPHAADKLGEADVSVQAGRGRAAGARVVAVVSPGSG